MPKRTDIHSILIIGAGPIVIGQACEFDYSGTQACKALREEGYRVVLVNSNPATIMTDPEIADRTYIEPITPEVVEKIIENGAARRAAAHPRRPDRRSTPRWRSHARRAGQVRRRDDRRQRATRSTRPRTASCSRRRWIEIGLESRAAASSPHHGRGARRVVENIGLPADHPPRLHPRRHRRRHRLQPRGVRATIVKRGLDASPDHRSAGRGVGHRLEGVRDGGDARQARTTASSSARSRTSTRWASTPATRSPSRRRRR